MKIRILLLLFWLAVSLIGVNAQNKFITVQNPGLYEVQNTVNFPEINGFTALDLFHEEVDNSIWVSPEKKCVSMQLTTDFAQDGSKSILLKWDKITHGCKWIGMGFGWNAWEPKELSLVFDRAAIQFFVKSKKDTLKSLPWAIALEDYSGVQAYTGFSPDFLEGPVMPNQWTKVSIPLTRFPAESYDLDLTLIKQFIIQFEAEGEIYVDNFSIVEIPTEPVLKVMEIEIIDNQDEKEQMKAKSIDANPQDGAEINDRIDKILKSMSIEEKAGQMTQLDLGVIAVGEICQLAYPLQLDEAKLKKAINDYKVGSILNCGCGSGTLELRQWREIVTRIQKEVLKNANKIPVLYGVDAIHGANYTIGATLFPQEIGQAATWNPDLVKKAAEVTAYECRASFIPWNFSPVLDLGRQPLWSRFFETYGEDTYLAKTMGKAAVTGYQGNNLSSPYSVAACGKHFLGYSVPLSGKDRTPAYLSPRDIREYFVPTFREAIQAGLKSVMINSGEISGSPVTADYDILTTLLREELKFEGIAVTDWGDIEYLHTRHKVAPTMREAVKMAIMAGVDMSMVPNNFEFTDLLIDLVKKGEIPESRLDLSVRRILKVKIELGLFENPYPKAEQYPDFGSDKFSTLSYDAAAESITLLKNQKETLPLAAGKKILLCGPAANSLNLLNGAWTHTWQGVDTTFNTKNKKTLKQALTDRVGKENLTYLEAATLTQFSGVSSAFSAAAGQVDYIVVCLGEEPCTEIPGNIKELDLQEAQTQLVKALSGLGKPLIMVTMFNRPRIIREIVPLSDAVLSAYLPGDMGGEAIADILIGKVNPSGKLPFTYPTAAGDILHYDRKSTEDQDPKFGTNAYEPQFDFGYGLSYTSFEYSDLKVDKSSFKKDEKVTVSVKVKNTGTRKGKEVVQLYYKDEFASITPAVKKLCAFSKTELNPGEEKKINFTVSATDFAFVAKNLQLTTEPGAFLLTIGKLSQTIQLLP